MNLLTDSQRDELKKAWIRAPIVDETCIWCGSCIAICPSVYDMNDDWFSVVQKLDNYEWLWVDDSINVCPTNSIKWV